MENMIKFTPKQKTSIIKVIGVGGGGSNAVNYMFKQGIEGVDFVVCNTDMQALSASPVPVKVQLGESGLGAGAIPEVAEQAALDSLDKIKAVLDEDTEMVFITAGMGGGTGTGAAPVIAKFAREMGFLTVGIVTLPFHFEGRRKMLKAKQGIEEIRKYVDTLLVISNDKLRGLYGDLGLGNAFAHADNVLATAAKGIAELITVHGYVNVDFNDVKTVMKDSGKAIMGSAVMEGEDRALKAIEGAMNSPLLNDNNIYGAKNILLYITAGEGDITMDEISVITDYIS
jgi:cell division protein FtsZ